MDTTPVVTIVNPTVNRMLADEPAFVSIEAFKVEPDGHLFAVGDFPTLTGLTSYPEFNGTKVEITAIRRDDVNGRCYYIKGDIDKYINWIYEYRLT